MAPPPRLSLKARAFGWLAQREHSRSELRRKLLRAARQAVEAEAAREAVAAQDASRPASGSPRRALGNAAAQPDSSDESAKAVEQLLDWLQAQGHLSEARFVESRVHTRAARYGNLRIRQELAQHGVAADDATLQQLRDTELARAREVWQRKFAQAPADPAERARQMRFLAQRGFSADVVRRVVQGGDDD